MQGYARGTGYVLHTRVGAGWVRRCGGSPENAVYCFELGRLGSWGYGGCGACLFGVVLDGLAGLWWLYSVRFGMAFGDSWVLDTCLFFFAAPWILRG